MGTSQSHDLGHCKCTATISLNEPLRDTAVTFFGKIQDVPINYIMGTLQSCDLEHCECPGYSPGQGNCRNTGRENLNVLEMDWVSISQVLCPFPCDVLVMYQPGKLALVPSVYRFLGSHRHCLWSKRMRRSRLCVSSGVMVFARH